MTKKKNTATIGKNADGYGYKYADMARVHDYIAEHNGSYYQYTKTTRSTTSATSGRTAARTTSSPKTSTSGARRW